MHNEELHVLYSDNKWVVKSGRMRWVGHVASVEEKRYVRRVLVGKPKAQTQQKYLGKLRHVSFLHQTARAFCNTSFPVAIKQNRTTNFASPPCRFAFYQSRLS